MQILWLLLQFCILRISKCEAKTFPSDVTGYVDLVSSLTWPSPLTQYANNLTDPCSQDPYQIVLFCTNETVTGDLRIQKIEIYGSNVSGRLSSNLSNLSALTSFSILGTQISGVIPESISKIYSLTSLNFNGNKFYGPLPNLRNLSLSVLDLGSNNLSGTIDSDIFLHSVLSLTFLNLSENRFSGQLPGSIENLSALNSVSLNNNQFSGGLPSIFSSLNISAFSDVFLNVSSNNFSGNLPSSILNAVNYDIESFIDVTGNNFSGYLSPRLVNSTNFRYSISCNFCNGVNLPSCGVLVNVSSSSGGRIGVIVAISVTVGACFFFGAVLIHKLWPNQQGHRSVSDWSNTLISFRLSEILEATKGLHFENILGHGGFGHVYKGTLHNGREVAVKVLNSESNAFGQGSKEYLTEIKVLGRVRHKNLVSLVGYCEENKLKILVYEFVANGSLSSHLYGNPIPLTWTLRKKILLQIAKGVKYPPKILLSPSKIMLEPQISLTNCPLPGCLVPIIDHTYLHEECSPPIVHRDLKPANILLDAHFDAKIADFGLAKVVPRDSSEDTSRVMGTRGYLAPEMASTALVTSKSDVFSFGVIALEVICGKCPSLDVDLVDMALEKKEAGLITDLIDLTLVGQEDFSSLEFVLITDVAFLCCQNEPEARPKLSRVLQMMERGISSTGCF